MVNMVSCFGFDPSTLALKVRKTPILTGDAQV